MRKTTSSGLKCVERNTDAESARTLSLTHLPPAQIVHPSLQSPGHTRPVPRQLLVGVLRALWSARSGGVEKLIASVKSSSKVIASLDAKVLREVWLEHDFQRSHRKRTRFV